jgi:NMD protein affecting ribosome stability and mRNA decay
VAKCNKCGDKSNPAEAKFCSKCGTTLGSASKSSKPPVETTFANKCHILADLWLNYRTDEEFEDFVEYNDIGLPLAYVLENEIADQNDESERFINETFSLLLERFEIEDQGFESIDELLDAE